METVNGLWIGTLGRLQILSIKSWLKAGYKYNLWVYDLNMENVPVGVKLCDANIILDEKYIFKHWSGTYATFADMFRYKLLYDVGGWWVDLDLVCLRRLPDIEIFFGAERNKLIGAFKSKMKHRLWIGLLKFPPRDEDPLCLNAKDPILKDMIDDMMSKIEDFQNPEKYIPFTYGQTRLDKLLKKIVGNDYLYLQDNYTPSLYNPLSYFDMIDFFSKKTPTKIKRRWGWGEMQIDRMLEKSYTIHLYNKVIKELEKKKGMTCKLLDILEKYIFDNVNNMEHVKI